MSQNKIIGTDILLEFLEVAFHSILYYRKLYPDEIFTKKKIYGLPINVSRHPELSEYIKNILSCIRELIQDSENNVKSVNLLYLNQDKIPVEKFSFHLDLIQSVTNDADPYFMKTEEALKTLCLKLSMLETYLEPLPNNCSFKINIVSNYAAYLSLSENVKSHNFPWIIDDNLEEIQNGLLLPIKNVETDYLILQCYAVENKQSKAVDK